MNTVKLIGYTGKEIVFKDLSTGKVANFSLATQEIYTSKDKEVTKHSTWHHIVAYRKMAERCNELFEVGKHLSIEGQIRYREYQNKDQITVKITEIVVNKVEEVVAAAQE
ncbi:single-stranded DNA-binding protein [Dyadobacter tibetensis]|uniref:single-stranded DNA-binding protein n=1 Tax=Dyadobacter tibetensis TaxID=1211851 RepID=UPI000472E814|nr:single-stranded DNA-binding protein [Dyadobacter tibetensis]